MKRKYKLLLLFTLFAVLLWQYGFFTRYNYLTAQLDIWKDTPRLVHVGIPLHPCGVPCIGLKEAYGFHESSVGCLVTSWQLRGIDVYNRQIERYLEKRNGKDWRVRYESEIDSLISNDLLE